MLLFGYESSEFFSIKQQGLQHFTTQLLEAVESGKAQ
jgi:hypothetical protein